MDDVVSIKQLHARGVACGRIIHYAVRMITLIGLRNPEPEYIGTRHNVGAYIARAFAEHYAFGDLKNDKVFLAEKTQGMVDTVPVRVLLPTTYMNNSGRVISTTKLLPQEIIVIHDELALPVGSFKVSHESGSAGHNGVADLIHALGTKTFTRVRVGIHPKSAVAIPGEERSDFVLKRFTPDERKEIDDLVPGIIDSVTDIVREMKK